MIGQTLETAEALGQAENLDGLQEPGGLVQTALDVERQHAAESAALAYGHGVLGVRRQAGMHDALDERVTLQESGHGQPVAHVLLHAHVQGLQAAVDQVTVERRRHDTARCASRKRKRKIKKKK